MNPEFALMWWRIGTLMNWQKRMQPALAVLAEDMKSPVVPMRV
jgi:hypothetical protein